MLFLKEKALKLAVKKQIYGTKLRAFLSDKSGSVTGDMGIWVFIVCAAGLLIVGLLIAYIKTNGFPAFTNRMNEIINFS